MYNLHWNGQEMTRDDNGHLVWVDTDSPVGGDSVSMGTLGMDLAKNGETVTHYEVPMTVWGDYCGSSVERSNYRALLSDYPDTFVEVLGGYHSQYLAIPVDGLTEDLREIFTDLVEQYPLYDESDHSELEMTEASEQYEQWAKADILSSLARDHDIDTDTIDEDWLSTEFWSFMSTQGEYPYLEDAVTIVYPNMDEFVTSIARTLKEGNVNDETQR
jgi:hypothetical protein